MSQEDFFQCLLCRSFFGTLWKVEKHIKQHENETDSENSCGRRRGMLPIKKVTFCSCFVPVVKNQIDPDFLAQYSEVQPKEEPQMRDEDMVASDFLTLKYENGCDDDGEKVEVFENTRRRRSSRVQAAMKNRRDAAVLNLPNTQDVDSEEEEDMEFVQDVLAKLPDEDDDDFKPPTYIGKNYLKSPRRIGRPLGSTKPKAVAPPKLRVRTKRTKTTINRKGNLKYIYKSYPCEYCSKSFSLRNDLYVHLYENHQDQAHMITCPVLPCGRPCLNFFTLRAHLQQHSDAERNEYDLLEKLNPPPPSSPGNTKETCDQESEIPKTKSKIYLRCKFCLETMESLQHLQDHLAENHNDSSILICPCCEKDTPENGMIHFIGHLKGLHPERIDPYNERAGQKLKEKKIKCDKCDAMFAFKYDLNRHLVNHDSLTTRKRQEQENDESRRFECPVCHKKFKYKDNLRRHFTLHLENNPFTCDFPCCNQKFNSDYNLRRHRALHYGSTGQVKRVYCPLCSASFTRKDKLPRHFRECHKPSDIDAANPNPITVQRRRRRYQTRLPTVSRMPRYPTYRSLEEAEKINLAAVKSIPSVSEAEGDVGVKSETVESAAAASEEEIHLVDRIILGSDGNAVHVKGEHLSPEKASRNLSSQPIASQSETNHGDISAESPAIQQAASLTKLIVSDPLFKKLAKDDPKKVKDVVTYNYNHGPRQTFTCHVCEAIFSRAWTLQLHLKTYHNKTIMDQEQSKTQSAETAAGVEKPTTVTIMCGTCAYPAKDAKELAKHIKLSHKPKSKCPKCGIYLDSPGRVQRHIQEIHSNSSARSFKCKFCESTFTNRGYLRNHEKRVHDDSDKPMERKRCPVVGCHRMLAPSGFYNHMRRHEVKNVANEKKHKCMLCGDALSCAMSLRRHIDAVHLGKPINKRQKDPGLKEAGPSKKGTVIRRGPKQKGDEWFQPLLEKALGFTPRNEDDQDECIQTINAGEADGEEEDEGGLNSILGF